MGPKKEVGEMARWFLLPGVFMFLVLHGCSTNVEVKCGPKGQMAAAADTTPDDEGGLCNVMSYSGSAVTFIDDNNGQPIPQGSQLTCSQSTRCKAPPLSGTCPGGTPCKTHRATNGSCYCGC